MANLKINKINSDEDDYEDALDEDFFHANDDFENIIDHTVDQEKNEKESFTETDTKEDLEQVRSQFDYTQSLLVSNSLIRND